MQAVCDNEINSIVMRDTESCGLKILRLTQKKVHFLKIIFKRPIEH